MRDTCALSALPESSMGSPDFARGVAGPAASANALVPAAFTAATLNVYIFPFSRPVTVCNSAVATELRANEVHVTPTHD